MMFKFKRLYMKYLIFLYAAINGVSFFALSSFFGVVYAASVNVSAEFKSDITQPQKNKFTNTTPKTGFCTRFPSYCRGEIFSVAVPGISAQKFYDVLSSDLRTNHHYYKIDAATRIVTLTNKVTGLKTNAKFRINIFSVRTDGLKLYYQITPSGGCSSATGGSGNETQATFSWRVPEGKYNCYSRLLSNDTLTNNGNVRLYELSFGYELETPDPLSLPSGEYEGEVVYTLGDGMDIDYYALSYSDNEVRIKINAKVEHAFFYRFPSGSENVKLSPPNGWSSWINGGMIPQKLSKEVPFTLSSSSGFKVWMQCEHNSGAGCGLKNQATAETVPLDVKMTIPGFNSNRQPVRNMLLNTDAAGHTIDLPGQFVVDLRSKLDFIVNRPEVEKMVKAPGSNWKGAVTLIFDSEVE
jgi:hypothetical protein